MLDNQKSAGTTASASMVPNFFRGLQKKTSKNTCLVPGFRLLVISYSIKIDLLTSDAILDLTEYDTRRWAAFGN
jgi:hypothetical protein